MEFGNILAHVLTSGYPLLTLIEKQTFTSKSNHLSASLQLYSIYYGYQRYKTEKRQALNKIEKLLANIKTKSCKEKIDEIFNTNDTIHNIGYRSLNKSLIIKFRINDELDDHYIIASYYLKELLLEKIKDENQFSLKIGPFKTNTQKKASRIQ